jgi:hypothetical protein
MTRDNNTDILARDNILGQVTPGKTWDAMAD